jgi:hypothetical protein
MIAFWQTCVLSLLPTFVSSRALLWLTRTWSDSVVQLLAMHLASLGLPPRLSGSVWYAARSFASGSMVAQPSRRRLSQATTPSSKTVA